MTASWLPIFVLAKPSRTIILIDRSEPRFEGRTWGKIRKTLKNDENLNVFCYFSAKSHSKIFRPDQKNEKRDIYLSNKKNYFCGTLTDDAKHKNVPPPLDLTRILKSYHKRDDKSKFPEK